MKRILQRRTFDTANASALASVDSHKPVVGNSAEDAARTKWNAEADGYNQWDSLGQDEKDDLIANDQADRTAKAGKRDGI